MAATATNTIKYLERSEPLCKLAYQTFSASGAKPLGGLYVPGLLGVMSGGKAGICEQVFRDAGCGFTRFDYSGLGESDPVTPSRYQFQQWRDDVWHVMEEVVKEPVILIGSSMGGWMSTMTALKFPDKVKGLFLISPALDFSDHFLEEQPPELIKQLEAGKTVEKNDEFGHVAFDMSFFKEGRANFVYPQHPDGIPVHCPVRIFHGMGDDVVPYQKSIKLVER